MIRIATLLLSSILVYGCASAPPITSRINQGDPNGALQLMRQGIPATEIDDNGFSPLHHAATKGYLKVTDDLIKRGVHADIKARDKYGQTPLMYATRNGHSQVADLLLKHGANINARQNFGWTPLMQAIRGEHPDIAIDLINRGANVNDKNNSGWDAIQMAARYTDSIELVELLLSKGANINSANSYNYTAVGLAAFGNNKNVAAYLIVKGADVNIAKTKGERKGENTLGVMNRKNNRAAIYAIVDRLKVEEQQAQQEVAEQEEQEKKQKQQQRVAALKAKSPCPMKEKGWVYTQGACSNGFASGKGEAMHENGELSFKGEIKEGKRVKGILYFTQTPMFDGDIIDGRPHGKGVCFIKGSPEECKYYKGERIDILHKQRLELAEQRRVIEAMQVQMKKDMAAIKNQAPQKVYVNQQQSKDIGDVIKEEAQRRVVEKLFDQLF